MAAEAGFNIRRIYRAAELFLKILVSADVVGIGMRILDGFEFPSLRVQDFLYLFRC